MFKLFISLRDSVNNTEISKATLKQEAKYEFEKQKAIDDGQYQKQKAVENAEYEKSLAIEKQEQEKQRMFSYTIASGLALVVFFLGFVFNRLNKTRKQKQEIELAHFELEEKNQEILDSIIYAKRIQSAILPPEKLVKKHLNESFILYKPKDVVAGDFYWMEERDNKVLFAAADCTGHGVSGAMVRVVCNNGLNRSVRE
ncbi:MAG: serine phosphatase RsbU (regulator of sigma subunit) [Flavobacteriales bacterium]|jgi:serine phosphatase RsbU (regulator of sigma subunit)